MRLDDVQLLLPYSVCPLALQTRGLANYYWVNPGLGLGHTEGTGQVSQPSPCLPVPWGLGLIPNCSLPPGDLPMASVCPWAYPLVLIYSKRI